jgi:peptidoglycan/LPS O-acetylase OafA/YrhL
MAAPSAAVASPAQAGARVQWLDGVRGLAAMFVVVHHIWLTAWPSDAPTNPGPWWLGWLLYGHMAVATFIVVSGFSLALAPMRSGGTLSGGVRRFLRRRAWRILPAYWAALLLSIVIMAVFLQPEVGPGAIGRTTAVYGLLLQDAVGSANPNGALWSIAVEWQIYFVFPLILLVGRRTSVVTAVSITAVAVLLAHAAAGLGGPFEKINGLTPQFLALFALGVLAVWLGRGDRPERLRRPLAGVALATLGSFVLLAATQGSEWMVARYFWMDLLFGVGAASLLAVTYAGGLASARRVLASRALMWLGLFSYSIYLIHDPIVGVLDKYAFGPMDVSPLATFGLSLALGVPVVLAFCYGFHLLFEAPFLRQRHLSALRTLPIVRLWPQRGKQRGARPLAPAEEVSGPTLVPAPQPATGERSAG